MNALLAFADVAAATGLLAAVFAVGWAVDRGIAALDRAYRPAPGQTYARFEPGDDPDDDPAAVDTAAIEAAGLLWLPCAGHCPGVAPHELSGDGDATCVCGTTTHHPTALTED